jgi:hypothetical protein
MLTINSQTEEFLKKLSYAKIIRENPELEETVKISQAASNLAVVYESARNAVEFRAEHLIRQGAINRILKRRLFLNQSSDKLASLLVKELLWGHYIKDGGVPISKIEKVAGIIDKYRQAKSQLHHGLVNSSKDQRFIDWLLGLASCEIEENLIFDPIPQILSNYVYESLSKRIDFPENNPETKSIQVYIAVERGFSQNNEIFISYRLLKNFFPEWVKEDTEFTPELYGKLVSIYERINNELNYPLKEALKRAVGKLTPPFNLIRELIREYPNDVERIIKDKTLLEETALEVLEEKYRDTGERLQRASTRSIIYIFLTKMILGLLLELPFDAFLGRTNFMALGINTLFPPVLMFLLNINLRTPDEENSRKMIAKIEDYFYKTKDHQIVDVDGAKPKRAFEGAFYFIYIVTFILVFGLIIWGLRSLHFNIVSQIIFLFFLSVVSFFAYRVRGIAKDYVLQEEGKEGLSSSFLSFVFLPIIKVGQWLSVQISNLNVLSIIFDFIIEAPLKAFLEVIEEWIHFVNTKQEEIVSS